MEDRIILYEDYKEEYTSPEILIIPGVSYDDYLLERAKAYVGVDELPAKDNVLAQVPALVDGGRWMWQCIACDVGVVVDMDRITKEASLSICPSCMYQGWVKVAMPDNLGEIEEELLRQPGFRLRTAFRNWEPHWSMDHLRHRTARAQEQVAQGVPNPRGASIGATRLWSVGEVLTAGNKNTFERQVLRDLAGRNGPIGPYESAIILNNSTTAQRNAFAAEAGMMLYNATTERFEGYGGSWGGFANAQLIGNIEVGRTSNNRTAQFHSVAHSLGKPPYGVHPYYVKVSGASEGGYSTGDSVSYTTMRESGINGGIVSMVRADYVGSIEYRWASLISADDDYIHVTYIEDDGGATHDIEIRQKNSTDTSGTDINTNFVTIDSTNWRLRFIVFG